MLEKISILSSNKGVDQGFGNPLIGKRNPIFHEKLPDNLVLLRVDDGIGVERMSLQWLKIREVLGIIEKEEPPRKEKEKY